MYEFKCCQCGKFFESENNGTIVCEKCAKNVVNGTTKFTIECEMKTRWVPHFLSMLKYMEHLGNIGSSRITALYSDGDGDFKPKFKPNIDFKEVGPVECESSTRFIPSTENDHHNHLYDAG